MEKLRKAVQKGSVEDVRALVLTGADVNALDKKGRKQQEQFLHLPAHPNIERQLRVSRVRSCPVVSCLQGISALHLAAQMYDLDLLEAILESPSVDVNLPDQVQGWSPLIHCLSAAPAGDTSILRRLLKVSGCNVHAEDGDGNTALHWAALLNQPEAVEVLLNRGASRNAVNAAKETALHVAVKEGNEEVVQLLIEKHFNVNAKDADGLTPLHIALGQREVNLANLLLQAENLDVKEAGDAKGNTPLHVAVAEGLHGFAEKLIERGFSPEARNLAGDTPDDLRARHEEEKQAKVRRQVAAKEEKELRKRHQEEEDRMHTEVSVFCRDYGLPDTVADIFYKKKFRYLDDAFFELSSATLKKLGLSNEEREQLEQAREKYLEDIEREINFTIARENCGSQEEYVSRCWHSCRGRDLPPDLLRTGYLHKKVSKAAALSSVCLSHSQLEQDSASPFQGFHSKAACTPRSMGLYSCMHPPSAVLCGPGWAQVSGVCVFEELLST
ncbi:ankyrin repeat-containing protein [Cystoisospora suis]|uniref:Ankyrin repeat-containing protein n=1 Tax=Cystoisospora suis TaxID=483139 RepID=A0A2C6KK66_9APIC|nr:ankyrin repeat-containing protein [Cystoisospora suis]